MVRRLEEELSSVQREVRDVKREKEFYERQYNALKGAKGKVGDLAGPQENKTIDDSNCDGTVTKCIQTKNFN